MILYPLNSLDRGRGGPVPAWEAIERKQKAAAREWWLIAQPDHAALAGDLAAAISVPAVPKLEPEVLQAISLHDQGWSQFDARMPGPDAGGRPKSFFEVEPGNILLAWRGSIEAGERASPIGGILVSEHFCRIGRAQQSLKGVQSSDEMMSTFLKREAERQERLVRQQPRLPDEIGVLVDVLQFCDLISLYLCCGCQELVEFPQKFGGETFVMRREGDLYCTAPALFGRGLSLAVGARKYPPTGHAERLNIPFLLA
jgi:hypothetical protein